MSWNAWRAEFPITTTGIIHFNHAGVSPISRRVAAAVNTFTTQAMQVEPTLQHGWDERGEAVRTGFARLVGAHGDEIAFVKNTSEGLSLVAASLDWRAGDNIIAVDGEYPSNIYPWFALRRFGVETRLVAPRNGLVHVDDVAARADARTRLVAVSFVDWCSGASTELAPIGSWCRARDIIFCVDGIQGVGAVRLDVEAANIDCLAVGGHKWLLAPEGCGCLYVSRRVIDRLHSVLHGWKSVRDASTYLPYHFEPRPDAAKFEPGSPPVLGIFALGAAIDLLLEIGPERISERILELTDRLAAGLRARGAHIMSPWERSARSGIVVFQLGDDPERVVQHLGAQRIVVRARRGGVRVAPHFYNSNDEIERLLSALDTLGS